MSGDVLVRRLCLGGASEGCSLFEPCPACREAFSTAVLAGAMEAAGITDEEQVVTFLDAYARLRGELAAMVRQALEEDARRSAKVREAVTAESEMPPPLPAQGPAEVAPPKSEPRQTKLRSVFDEAKSRSEIPPPANDQSAVTEAKTEENQKEEGVGT